MAYLLDAIGIGTSIDSVLGVLLDQYLWIFTDLRLKHFQTDLNNVQIL